MLKAIIVGATSGIGKELALQLLAKGWELGIAGRRTERLEEIKAKAPEKFVSAALTCALTMPPATC